MMKRTAFLPAHRYLIRNAANNADQLFYEKRNYDYFLLLFERHVAQIATLESCKLFPDRFEMIVRIKEAEVLSDKYRDHLHRPFANMFNAYAKSINKAYGRSGSLFREHFFRHQLADLESGCLS